MNKYPCALIKDLIPLYIEGEVSGATREMVEEHLQECEDCRLLVQEYSDSKLDIADLKEDLPQANTFKRWMNRLKIWGAAACILMLAAVIAAGAFGYKTGEKSRQNLLTQKKIVKTFKAGGLALREDESKAAEDHALGGVEPAVYSVGENEGTLLIYIFKSFGEKKETLGKTAEFDNSFAMETRAYHAKNALLVFKAAKTPETQEELEGLGSVLTKLAAIVFQDLNEGKVRVYRGESESWAGTFTLKYYEHWFEEAGSLYYDSYHTATPALQYKKTDIENVGPLTFEYEAGSSGGSAEGYTLNKEGYAALGSGGGNGAILSGDAEVRFTVKWGNKEEIIILKGDS